MRFTRKTVVVTGVVLVLLAAVSAFVFFNGKNEAENPTGEPMQSEGEILLSAPAAGGGISLAEALANRRSFREYIKKSLAEREISQLLWSAQGITDRPTGFRTSPSAGALYPLEVYMVVGMADGVPAGIYKYSPQNHSILLVREGDVREELYRECLSQDSVKNAAAVLVFSAVFERTASRYGDRAERYVYMEVGHASQNVYLQAESLNLGTVAIGAFDEDGVKEVLGLPGDEEPVYIMPVGHK